MKNIIRNKLFASFISLFLIFTPLKAEVNVVTSIKPLHSLTSYIMDGVGEPGLIIDGLHLLIISKLNLHMLKCYKKLT